MTFSKITNSNKNKIKQSKILDPEIKYSYTEFGKQSTIFNSNNKKNNSQYD